MKTNSIKRISQTLSVTALVTFGASVFAAPTWNLDGCTLASLSGSGSGCGTVGNTVKATAYAVNNTNPSTSTFVAGGLASSAGSGLRVNPSGESTLSPEHAMDNVVSTELIAFKFDKAVILDSITLGWTSSDADFTLMAYTGSGTPTIAGKTVSGLAAGWSLVKSYGSVSGSAYADNTTDLTTRVNAGNVSSSWWIVSAYNSGYGGGTLFDSIPDYMKIMTIASRDPVSVPEPGSIALLGLGLVGLVASSRRSQKVA